MGPIWLVGMYESLKCSESARDDGNSLCEVGWGEDNMRDESICAIALRCAQLSALENGNGKVGGRVFVVCLPILCMHLRCLLHVETLRYMFAAENNDYDYYVRTQRGSQR